MVDRAILARIDERIAAGQATIVGFDIFDTVITRVYPKEFSLEVMCRAIAKAADGWPDRHDLVRKAYEAAYHASARINSAEGFDYEAETGALFDQWLVELQNAGMAMDRATLVAAIVQIETTLIEPIPETVHLLEALVERGVRCIYVSDMYLGRALVDRILEAKGLLEYFDTGFVSSDKRLLKRTGDLFPVVLEKAGIPSEDLVFLGDDRQADHDQPRALGIEAFHYSLDRHEQERQELRDAYSAGQATRETLVAAVLRSAAGLHFGIDSVETYATAKYLGPYFGSFALAVHERYRSGTYGQVLFCAREGLLLMRLSDCFDGWDRRRTPPKVYFPASRLTSLAFGLHSQPFDLTNLSDLMRNGQPSLRTALSFLRLPEERLVRLATDAGLADPDVHMPAEIHRWPPAQRIVELVNDLPEFAAFQQQGALFEEWMTQQGVLDGRLKLLVDLGWSGQIQDNLARGFRRRGIPAALDGQYSGMRLEAHWRRQERSDLFWFHCDECSDDTATKAPLWFPQLLETICRAPHGTITGFRQDPDNGGVGVVFKTDRRPEEVADDPLICRLHDLLERYCVRLAALAAVYRITAHELRTQANAAIFNFLVCPEVEVARRFACFCNISDLGSDEVFRYQGGQGRAPRDLPAFGKVESGTLWPTGAAAAFFGQDYAATYAGDYIQKLRNAGILTRRYGFTLTNASRPLNQGLGDLETPRDGARGAREAWSDSVSQLILHSSDLAAKHRRTELRMRRFSAPHYLTPEARGLARRIVEGRPRAEPVGQTGVWRRVARFFPKRSASAAPPHILAQKEAAEALARERFETIQAMDRMVAERDRTIEAQEKMVLERWDAMQEMGRHIFDRDNRIKELEAELQRLREKRATKAEPR